MFVEEVELAVSISLIRRKARRRRTAGLERLLDLGRDRTRHVGVNANEFRWSLHCHLLGNCIAPVAPLCYKSGVTKPFHQHRPSACDMRWIPADRSGLSGEPISWQWRDYDV